jgi:S-formylglutathione hydrolase FrmB
MSRPRGSSFRTLAAALAILAGQVFVAGAGQTPAAGTVEVLRLPSRALEGNLIGDSAERSVSVYLPSRYASSGDRRYPVLYMLHGFTDSDAKWFGRDGEHWIHLPTVLDRAFGMPDAEPMIVVMPDGHNAFGGSFYAASVTIGDWETFVAEELVAEIDRRYRTRAGRDGRGLAGHSMGGYGAIRIGMKRPDVFSAVYAMSACCLTPPAASRTGRPSAAEAVTLLEQVASAGFGVTAALATAAAFAPNPNNPPLYLDLPTRAGEPQADVLARLAANAPVAMAPQHVFSLRRLRGLAFDIGTRDGLLGGNEALDRVLTAHDVSHVFETYEGDHLDGVASRIVSKVVPFFSQLLGG